MLPKALSNRASVNPHDLEAGPTKTNLARFIGTKASVIRRRDADDERRSMTMPLRIEGALTQGVEIRFVSVRRSDHPDPGVR